MSETLRRRNEKATAEESKRRECQVCENCLARKQAKGLYEEAQRLAQSLGNKYFELLWRAPCLNPNKVKHL